MCLRDDCTHTLLTIALGLMALGSAQASVSRSSPVAAVAAPAAQQAAASTASAATSPFSAEHVIRATQAVASQADWGGWRQEKQWRFKPPQSSEKKPLERDEPRNRPQPEWLRWLAEGTRFLMWLLCFAAVATFAVYAWRWLQVRADAIRPRPEATFTSHVQSLDIRPESLPDDIGAHARRLWQSGQHRAALSLLYRGALSRLVHQHRVPVDAAATEDECLSAAQKQLPKTSATFFETLVRTWQKAVYGGHLPADEPVLALCDGFNAAWAASSPPAASSAPHQRP